MITLERSRPFGYLIRNADGRTVLVQLDWDYPGVASTFGWSIRAVQRPGARPWGTTGHPLRDACSHDGSDGTIACDACGTAALTFIDAAADWLDEHDGAAADDPGYFLEDHPEDWPH